jgi:CheY-like chemotaxis protein
LLDHFSDEHRRVWSRHSDTPSQRKRRRSGGTARCTGRAVRGAEFRGETLAIDAAGETGVEGHPLIALNEWARVWVLVAAVRMLAEEPMDVVSLDMNMPGLSGVDALPTIRAIAPAAAVIMVTGNSDRDQAKRAVRYGAFHYLVKPINWRVGDISSSRPCPVPVT